MKREDITIKYPLFTDQHGQHSSVWSVPGFTLPTLCIACAIERLENKAELNLHIKKILTELQALLSEGTQSKLLGVLKSDGRVMERLCSHLFGIVTILLQSNFECCYLKRVTDFSGCFNNAANNRRYDCFPLEY